MHVQSMPFWIRWPQRRDEFRRIHRRRKWTPPSMDPIQLSEWHLLRVTCPRTVLLRVPFHVAFLKQSAWTDVQCHVHSEPVPSSNLFFRKHRRSIDTLKEEICTPAPVDGEGRSRRSASLLEVRAMDEPHLEGHGRCLRQLLECAHEQVRAGRPEVALRAVMEAIRRREGEEAVANWMAMARERFHNESTSARMKHAARVEHMEVGESTSDAEDELVGLMAGCLLVEQPERIDTCRSLTGVFSSASILEESGRGEIQIHAAMDGSSYYCSRCGALVSARRALAHDRTWCTGLPNNPR